MNFKLIREKTLKESKSNFMAEWYSSSFLNPPKTPLRNLLCVYRFCYALLKRLRNYLLITLLFQIVI